MVDTLASGNKIRILQYFDFISLFMTNQTGASLFVLAQHWPHGQTILELFGRKGATCFQLDSDFFCMKPDYFPAGLWSF